jgi:hypothetical protein
MRGAGKDDLEPCHFTRKINAVQEAGFKLAIIVIINKKILSIAYK